MKDVITLGEAIIAFEPWTLGPMEHAHTFERKVGGAELNFAIGCSRLGLQAGWISHLGNDPFGLMIRNFIRGEGVDVSQVKFIDDYNTSIYFKEMFDSGDVHAYYYRDRSPVSVMKPTDLNESYFKRAKVLHLTGIFPAINPEKNMKIVHHAIKLAKKHDVKVSFDPNIRLKMWSKEEARRIIAEILPDVDILLASDDELEIILESKNPEQVFKKAEQLGISTVAMKRAENSTIGYDKGETIEVNTFSVENVVDTVGAGDGFDAGFIYGYLKGWQMEKVITFANMVGSMVVGVKGDNEGLPYLEDVLARIDNRDVIER